MKKLLIVLFALTLPAFATEKNDISDTEIEQTIKELVEAKKTGVNTSVLGASITVLGGTIFSKGGPEIAGLGFGMSVAGVIVSALGCYINFANGRQLKRFLEDHNIELEIK